MPDFREVQLKQLKRAVIPKHFLFVDVESKLLEKEGKITPHEFWFGHAIYCKFDNDGTELERQEFTFNEIIDFWIEFIEIAMDVQQLIVIAHNINYDLAMLNTVDTLVSLEFECESSYIKGMSFIQIWSTEDCKITFINNANWFPMKLKMLGASLGYDKLEVDVLSDNYEKLLPYCIRDVEILVQAQSLLLRYLHDNNLNVYGPTLGSLAFKSYRHSYLPKPLYLPRDEREMCVARNSYKGGRTEPFKLGHFTGENFYKLDVNSMYPAMMKSYNFPTRLQGIYDNLPLKKVIQLCREYCLAVNCIVNTTDNCIPYKLNNKTIYPIGIFEAYLSTPELLYLQSKGAKFKFKQICVYYSDNIFYNFVDTFYNLRKQYESANDKGMSLFTKLLLNNLYGKFGQQDTEEFLIGYAEPNTFETSHYYDSVEDKHGSIRQIGTSIIRQERGGEGKQAFVAIAAHVTAYARIYLYKLIRRAGINNVYYCDTDSLIVNEKGYNNLSGELNDTELGALKLEGISDDIEIIAKKFYRFGDEIKRKGVPKNAVENADGTFTYQQWPGFNVLQQQTKYPYYNREITKVIKPELYYANMDMKGNLKPIVINEYKDITYD